MINMKNCIIILNYNDLRSVTELISRIVHYDALQHVVIVDNCSTDGSYEKLSRIKNDKVDVIQCTNNGGYASGNNFGARYALNKWDIDVLFFANPDVSFSEETVIKIEKALYQNKSYAVAAPLVQKGYNVWKLPKFWGTVRMLFLLTFTLHKLRIEKKLLCMKGVHEVEVVEGSFFAIKASAYEEVDGFDERTFLYLEENILAYKLRQKGYCEVVDADTYYLHEHSKSISKEYHSKANAFKLFLPSFDVYLKYYLECGPIGLKVFHLFYLFGYLERMLFDVVKRKDV